MKGFSFQNGVEFKINIEGEQWSQGDEIKFSIESKPKHSVYVALAEGVDKKVKAKTADAFTILHDLQSDDSPFLSSFQLKLNSPISDKSASLYLLYGRGGESSEKLGQLRLNIVPHQHLKDLIETMTSHFRFALKSMSATKNNKVEVKLDPSGSKDWASLELLTLKLSLDETTLSAQFVFHRNEVDPTKGGLAKKLVKREVERDWLLSDLVHSFNQRVNKEVLIASIDQVIAEYRETSFLGS